MKFVQTVKKPNGSVRHYFRRKGFPRVRLHGEPGTPQFEKQLKEAGGESEAARHREAIGEARTAPTGRQKRRPVYVYLIHCPSMNAIKIGSSVDVVKRLRTFRTAWPGEVTLIGLADDPIGGGLERVLHRRFKHLRMTGEWYQDAPELRAWAEKWALFTWEDGVPIPARPRRKSRRRNSLPLAAA